MSLLAMPFLIINYGGEMIYILEQRLHSQQIKAERAQKVLHDLTRALFNEPFVSELLRPQALYTFEQTRDVCDKLAQSSIMKLSTDSMDKLFDLVVMGVKYQVMLIRHPCELIDITLNHIDYIAKLVKQSQTTTNTIEKAKEAFVAFARELRVSEFAQVRQALCEFSIRKRVKVSLFLQQKMQHHDGRFVIPTEGSLPNEAAVQMPGTIKNEDGSRDTFNYPLASDLGPKLTGDPFDSESRDCTLGQNVYVVDRKKSEPAQKQENPPPKHGETGSAARAAKTVSAGAQELNSLGSLLGVSSQRPAQHNFKLSLFEESQDSTTPLSGTEVIHIRQMNREDLARFNKELVDVIEGTFNIDSSKDTSKPTDIGDLLDMVSND